MPKQQMYLVPKKLTLGSVIISALALGFRFFLGLPMNGKRTDNSTFLKGATRGKPGKVLTRWQKKPILHRMLIRHSVFWPVVGAFILYLVNPTVALFVYACISIPTMYLAFRKGRLAFFDPYTSTDATTGHRTQYWGLKNKYRRLLRMQPRPGLITRKTKTDDILPEAVEKAILMELNTGPLKGKMPALRVRRYVRRDR